MIIDSTGNVGIGTSSPRSTATLSASGGNGGVLTLENLDSNHSATNTLGKIQFYSNDGSAGASGVRNSIDSVVENNFGATSLVFSNAPSSNPSLLERLRITSAGNVGIGTTSPDSVLHVTRPTTEGLVLTLDSAGVITRSLTVVSSTKGSTPGAVWTIGAQSTVGELAFATNSNTERLRIDSAGNLGLGVTTPVSLLEVQGGLTTTGAVVTLSSAETSTVANDVLGRVNFRAALDAAGGDAILTGASIVALAEGTFSSTSNATSLLFQTGSSEAATTKMTLTSAGNLGLGVTPRAWGAGTRALDIGNGSALYNPGSNTQTWLLNNAFNDGVSFKYKNNGAASWFQQSGALSAWHNAPSGTAGDPITFTQAMTLDTSGNLLVAQTAVGNGGKIAVNGRLSISSSSTGTPDQTASDFVQKTSGITTATTIVTDVVLGLSSASAAYMLVHGSDNAGNRFLDVVVSTPSGTPVVLSSTTTIGSPTARTYTMSSFALQLAMASGTYSTLVKVTTISHPF
jgi:hypothetical protein